MAGNYFLRNHWYVVAHSFEVKTEKPLARTICDEQVVIFRTEDGTPAMLNNRCPHRKAPLSSGEVCGNVIACGYHGIRFNTDGSCASIPGGLEPPKNFATRGYPVVERHGWIWAWLGEKTADPSMIPDFYENDHPEWAPVPGYLNIACNYQLMVDNILDLTHVVFVHKTTLSGGGVTDTPLEVKVEGDKIFSQRLMYNVTTAPIFARALGLNGMIDRWQIFEYDPPMYVKITVGAKEAGSDSPMGHPVHRVLNCFTPETENSLHYFWSTPRSWALDDPKVDQLYDEMIWEAFNEDKVIVEQQQALIDSDPAQAPLVALPFDRAGNSARRILKRLMDEEQAEAAAKVAAE
jgi:phenylpropionate dioxygenase-like ring-hydroxylating dioxygenase large terminal subunit